MAEPYLGQVYLVGYNFAQRGFAFCDGQLLPISANSALFSLLGTTFGGDGVTTFALPDLRGRTPIGRGHGPGLSVRSMGQRGGLEDNTLTVAEMPSHNHAPTLHAELNPPATASPAGGMLSLTNIYAPVDTSEDVQMASNAIRSNNVGGNLPVNNMQPFLVMNYEIALQGLYPSRS